MKISTEHRDALNEALDETAGYEGDVYVFDVKHIEILRSAVIAMLEDDEQTTTVAPAVDAQPVGVAGAMPGTDGFTMAVFKADDVPIGTALYASAQSEGLRKDAWQPIETAPKDGAEVLLIATRHSMLMPHAERIVGAYRNGWWSGPSTLSHVTHWMPLPEAPGALSQKKSGE